MALKPQNPKNLHNSRLSVDVVINHIMKYGPLHKLWVHRMFSPDVVLIFGIVTTFFAVTFLSQGQQFIGLVSATVVGAMVATFEYLFIRMEIGHGVTKKESKSKRKIKLVFLGLSSTSSFIIFSIFVLFLMLTTNKLIEDGFKDLPLVRLSLMYGLILVILMWKFNMYYETYYFDEKNTRLYLESKGYNKIDIDLKIHKLKRNGDIYPEET